MDPIDFSASLNKLKQDIMMLDTKLRLLVLCTANRCRSQMGEGWLRYFAKDRAVVRSAGTAPKGVHPLAIQVMAEAGVDISGHTSDHVDQYREESFDVAITVCDRAKEVCPVFPNAKRLVHHAFTDPDQPGLSQAQLKPIFERVRDEIRDWARDFMATQWDARDVGIDPAGDD